MSSNKKIHNDNKDLQQRMDKLFNNDKPIPNDDELAQRFKNVFTTAPSVNEKKPFNYTVPDHVDDKEVERLLQEAETLLNLEDSENDTNDDDYLADILNTSSKAPTINKTTTKAKLDAWQDAFLGSPSKERGDIILDDEGHQLLCQLQDQAAVESKYAAFEQQRDDDLERRYLALKKDGIISSSSSATQQSQGPLGGSVPKPLTINELHDEMDDWCCVCNEDATIECQDCDNDRFCQQCFYDGHQSDMADYEFTKHRAKKYSK
ncbi:uncharacterized protein BX664DRAFT_322684 [Halteromyces radiatus]|uniref:uncharacterized protein n=1 Tax=Halteromyces radiatus TaxID=101107 RepID=UPI00222067A7|nr:uncharacterized protein BX664DRAFT_322684 [Halteromyces radiatus]KAI8100024.1 hypothetical protein BX664DRAFT_322684 [Halteromyces radiatus]